VNYQNNLHIFLVIGSGTEQDTGAVWVTTYNVRSCIQKVENHRYWK